MAWGPVSMYGSGPPRDTGSASVSEINSQVVGEFTGYNDGAVFQLTNGQVWQQSRYKYNYKYKYRPRVRIYLEGGRWMAEFDCMEEPIEVVQATILEQGIIVSDFNGFDGDARFEFQSGQVWEQTEYKYKYHYAHRPPAMVVNGINGVVLHVEGMDESVRVRRA